MKILVSQCMHKIYKDNGWDMSQFKIIEPMPEPIKKIDTKHYMKFQNKGRKK